MAKSFLQTIKNMINHNTAIIIIGILLIIIVLLFIYLPSSQCPAMKRYEYFAQDDRAGDNEEDTTEDVEKEDEEKIAHKAAEKVISALAEFNKQQQEQDQPEEDEEDEFEEDELEAAEPAVQSVIQAPAPASQPMVSQPSKLDVRTCNYLNARNGIVDRCDDIGQSCTRCKEGDFCLFGSPGNDQPGVYEGNLICKKGKWTDENPKNRK